jgi:flavin reductase (DIM6/NTAB) family NADH-FMN oxidoreductase RutF
MSQDAVAVISLQDAPQLVEASRADARLLRDAYGRFPTGIAAIAAMVNGRPDGMAVSTFVPVSLEPPLVAFCIQNTSATWERLKSAGSIGVSVLSEEHAPIVRQLAEKGSDRFRGVAVTTAPAGSVFLNGASAWFDTTVSRVVPAGDHAIVVLQVTAFQAGDDIDPAVFHGSRVRKMRSDVPAGPGPKVVPAGGWP